MEFNIDFKNTNGELNLDDNEAHSATDRAFQIITSLVYFLDIKNLQDFDDVDMDIHNEHVFNITQVINALASSGRKNLDYMAIVFEGFQRSAKQKMKPKE